MKQWEKKPNEIDPRTPARVPVRLSEDDRYFTDEYQGLPLNSYTDMILAMLENENISVETGVDALDRIKLSDGKIYFDGNDVCQSSCNHCYR
jgi:UDP-galactopyranose mutase